MEIFRHYYTAADLDTLSFHNQHLNNFGFCNLDGSKINYDWGNNTSLNFRYSLDAKKQSYFVQSVPSYSTSRIRTLNMIGFHRSDNNIAYGGLSSANGPYNNTTSATVVFLPLKNNGFLLNIRAEAALNLAKYNVDQTNANDQQDYSYNINTPTPSLNTKVYSTNDIGYANQAYPSTVNFIGIPPCKGNLNWTYIFYSTSTYTSSGGGVYNHIIDFGDGKVIDLPFLSNFIRTHNGSTAYNEPTYTNINNNICSMIKLPYDNSYIDGIYLLTTAPQQLEDATFFSFDGRNFLNAFDNYVFELPPSTT